MRRILTLTMIFISSVVLAVSQDPAADADRSRDIEPPDPRTVLRTACELAFQLDDRERYWSERLIQQIADVQIRACDFESAANSLRKSGQDWSSSQSLIRLAEALALDGQFERSQEILKLCTSAFTQSGLDQLNDKILARWIEYLITHGDYSATQDAIRQLKTTSIRVSSHQKLIEVYAKSGLIPLAEEQFTAALIAVENETDEFTRLNSLQKIAEQQVAMGNRDAAMQALHHLSDITSVESTLGKVKAFAKSAIVAASLNDEFMARQLFEHAIEEQSNVDRPTKVYSLMAISEAQASAGFINDAAKTAELISDRPTCQLQIAMAQFMQGDNDGAYRRIESIQVYGQFQDDAYDTFVRFQLEKGDFERAIVNAEKIRQLSMRAAALLRNAKAIAIAGDQKRATEIAEHINLTRQHVNLFWHGTFQFHSPQTWGLTFDQASTISQLIGASKRAAEVASAAMSLAIALNHPPTESWVVFKDFDNEVIYALAREHARSGNANDALGWSRQIGSGNFMRTDDDPEGNSRRIEQRIHALIGVADGILDRRGVPPTKPY